MRTAAAATSVVVMLMVPGIRAGGGGPDFPTETVLRFRDWVTAVNTHTPGQDDAPVETMAAFSFQSRKDLNTGMGLFLTVLMGKKVIIEGENQKLITTFARNVRANPGTSAFLKRAVVLHADAAAYAYLHPVHTEPAVPAEGSTPGGKKFRIDSRTGMPTDIQRSAPEPPPLTTNRLVLDKDGEILGEVTASWNWPFARSLLDLLVSNVSSVESSGPCRGAECAGVPSRPARPGIDPFVGAWYHATTAYMFANGLYGEATPHLQRAGVVLPADARILFDRACYAEILGLPMHQVLLPDDLSAERARNTGAVDWTGRRPSTDLGIPRAEVTNAEAERLFRRALQADPGYIEARVRLARLLDLRKRHEEAAAELSTALAAGPTGTVAFYAHLFAGRAAQALGRIDEAVRHYQDAAALFPAAQSALLAQSQVALFGADVPAALASVRRLGPRSAEPDADPWWQYHFAAGRDADALMREVWAMVPR